MPLKLISAVSFHFFNVTPRKYTVMYVACIKFHWIFSYTGHRCFRTFTNCFKPFRFRQMLLPKFLFCFIFNKQNNFIMLTYLAFYCSLLDLLLYFIL